MTYYAQLCFVPRAHFRVCRHAHAAHVGQEITLHVFLLCVATIHEFIAETIVGILTFMNRKNRMLGLTEPEKC